MITRGDNFKPQELNIVGSSIFGRYPKISIEKTYNMFESQEFMVPYAGYQIAIPATSFMRGKVGRGCFNSTKFDRLVIVIDAHVYLVTITFNQATLRVTSSQVIPIGTLQTTTGVVYISENNKPQIGISDGTAFYIYDPTLTPSFVVVPLNFVPGYLTFHDTYFILAASQDNTYSPPANNTWRLSLSNEGYLQATTFTSAANVITPAVINILANGGQIYFLGTTILIPGIIYYAGNFTPTTFQVFATYSNAINNVSPLTTDAIGSVGINAWPSTAGNVGLLESKPDNVQAVVRFPSKGNMIIVMGSITTEFWFDTGAQLFPYQRNNQSSIDYGCLQPATVAYMDELVVWLAANEKSGPIIMYSDGGMPTQITTDGIDYLFSTLNNPEDSQAFLYRQDGHLFYHINFYTDNLSLFYDFNLKKFYHATNYNMNYFIAAELAYFNNQYYFVSKNSGNLYAFDTAFTTYEDAVDSIGTVVKNEIPRIRICKNIRSPGQDYFIANDIGFTIESGETNYQQQSIGNIRLVTQCGSPLITQYPLIIDQYLFTQNCQPLITQDKMCLIAETGPITGTPYMLITQDGQYLISQDNKNFITQQTDNIPNTEYFHLIAEQDAYIYATPRVDLSLSYDGGASFGNDWGYDLPGIGQRRNRLMWWNGGIANDMVCQFKFWGLGRFVVTNGTVNIRM